MNIILGVSGGISAYKACDIISKLKYLGHSTRVITTKNAEELVTRKLFASLSGFPVLHDLWEEAENGEIDHINIIQQWATLFVVAPATANVIGKFANGIADDYLTTAWMAAQCPKIVAPAMNTTMLYSPGVVRNLEQLEKDGVTIVEPAAGKLACGTVGLGKLAKVDDIVAAIVKPSSSTQIDKETVR